LKALRVPEVSSCREMLNAQDRMKRRKSGIDPIVIGHYYYLISTVILDLKT
jgi:hypothetical protein